MFSHCSIFLLIYVLLPGFSIFGDIGKIVRNIRDIGKTQESIVGALIFHDGTLKFHFEVK